jgi:hypothetical protein
VLKGTVRQAKAWNAWLVWKRSILRAMLSTELNMVSSATSSVIELLLVQCAIIVPEILVCSRLFSHVVLQDLGCPVCSARPALITY